MSIELRPVLQSFVVALFAALLVLPFQGSRGLWEPDEGRYTCVAVQMLHTGDFISPAFNDEVVHFTKPPFAYWAIAGGISLIGHNEWGVRLANVFAFIATAVVVYWMGRTFTPSKPWLPSLIYATFPAPFGAANMVTTDTLLTLWEGVAVLGFVRWWASEDRSPKKLFLMWGGFGMAFLTKGPPGLLPLLSILFFVLLAEGWRSASRLVSLKGLMAFAVVGFGWYAVVAATHPGLLRYFIREEFINRIATGAPQNRNPGWYMPFVIYLPVLIGGTFPYTYSLLRAIPVLLKSLLSQKGWRVRLSHDWRVAFLIVWFFLPFVIFCVSRSRLPLYILPLFMPLALVSGRLLEHQRPGRLSFCLLIAWILFLLVAKWGVAYYPYQGDSRPLARAIGSTIDPIPREVLFVNNSPYWGVSLYLGCEVEEAVSVSKGRGRNSSIETLENELVQMESGTLIVVLKSNAERILTILDDLGYGAKILGEFQRWVFITPGSVDPLIDTYLRKSSTGKVKFDGSKRIPLDLLKGRGGVYD